jgi:hypothetical protein
MVTGFKPIILENLRNLRRKTTTYFREKRGVVWKVK